MILSKAGKHALRVALHLARERDGRFVPVRRLAECADAPFHYLAKICQRLTQAGILESNTGPRGGVALAVAPRDLTLLAVIDALGGLGDFRICVLGLEACNERSPCPLHDRWSRIKAEIEQMLAEKSLEDLVAGHVPLDV